MTEAGGGRERGSKAEARRGASGRAVRGVPEAKRSRDGDERSSAGRVETVAAARKAAFRVLMEVGAGRGHSDELLHEGGTDGALAGLSEADRNLATALVMGVLRWQIALDRRLRTFFSRPDAAPADEVMVALRMGAFQLLHMDRIPAHAALSESVELCRAAGQEHATGMVNAVLRKVVAGPKTEPEKVFEPVALFAERLGHPAWMVERWAKEYGRGSALRICESDQREPTVAGLFDAEQTPGLPVMDEGSRLVAELAAEAAPKVAGRALRVWDCCAAPGGKTAVLATRLPEAELLATDVSGRRLRLMEERLGLLAASAGGGGRVRCRVADATKLPRDEGQFDLVLCDVPCSGTGTLRRNPEIRLRLAETELGRQAERQRLLLAAAMERVAVGGSILYSTCSLEPEECELVIVAALRKQGGGWRRVGMESLLGRVLAPGMLTGAIREDALRTLPGVHPMDGFYAVALERG